MIARNVGFFEHLRSQVHPGIISTHLYSIMEGNNEQQVAHKVRKGYCSLAARDGGLRKSQ